MAPRKRASDATLASARAASPSPSSTAASTAVPPPPAPKPKAQRAPHSAREVALRAWDDYVEKTAQRTKLIDVFMAFLVCVGAVQFLYCVLVGNYPFNAFLSGFSATVGQFVLTASLRIQSNPENKSHFSSVSPERAFADYIFGSMLLHFFCVNFIN